MRSFTLFFIFCCLFIQILSRPRRIEEDDGEIEGKEYDMGSVAAEDETRGDYSRDKEQDSDDREEDVQSQTLEDARDRTLLERTDDNEETIEANPVYFSGDKSSKSEQLQDGSEVQEGNQSFLKNHARNKYVDNSDTDDQQVPDQHLKYREVDSDKYNERNFLRARETNKESRNLFVKDEGNMVFNEKSKMSNMDNNKYDKIEERDSKDNTYYKSFNYAVNPSSRDIDADETRQNYLHRDSRQVKNIVQKTDSLALESNDSEKKNNDEESAIKRHIRKLSKDELEELKSTLSDDKKALLNKFIGKMDDSENNNDSINKREITKKAGAIEDINLIDSEISNSIKNQGVTSDLEFNTDSSVSQNTKNKESNEQPENQTENNSMSTSKSTEPTESDKPKTEIGESSLKNQADLISDVPLSTKNQNKRDTSSADFAGIDESMSKSQFIDNDNQNWQGMSNEKECDCSRAEDVSRFLNDDSQSNDYNLKNKKRETDLKNRADFCDSFKSLEESFPRSSNNDEAFDYSGPLIRVKRKNSDQVVKKRSAGILPDSKVAYFPYKSENEDDDNDEGNEFDDEGFYERTNNFAKNNELIEKADVDYGKLSSHVNHAGSAETNNLKQNLNIPSKLSEIETLSEEKTSLGSDTDSVLSGIEGVDDNIMYNNNFREKRTSEDVIASSSNEKLQSLSENKLGLLSYQENDAFGPLPRNYEGDLGRYKRIRRLKQTENMSEKRLN